MLTEKERRQHSKLFHYFVNKKCACGGKKISGLWVCPKCWEKMDGTLERQRLVLACHQYFVSATEVVHKARTEYKEREVFINGYEPRILQDV